MQQIVSQPAQGLQIEQTWHESQAWVQGLWLQLSKQRIWWSGTPHLDFQLLLEDGLNGMSELLEVFAGELIYVVTPASPV